MDLEYLLFQIPTEFLRHMDQMSMVVLKRCNRLLYAIVKDYFIPRKGKKDDKLVLDGDHLDLQHRIKNHTVIWKHVQLAACQIGNFKLIKIAESKGECFTTKSINHVGASGNMEIAKYVVENCIYTIGEYDDVFDMAITNSHYEVYDYLIENVVNDGTMDLYISVDTIDLDMLTKVFENNESYTIEPMRSILRACETGNVQLIQDLINIVQKWRKDYNFENMYFDILMAIFKNKDIEKCKSIIDIFENLVEHSSDGHDKSYASAAAYSGNVEVLRTCMRHDDYLYSDILDAAFGGGHVEAVKEVISFIGEENLVQTIHSEGIYCNCRDTDLLEIYYKCYNHINNQEELDSCVNWAVVNGNRMQLDFFLKKGGKLMKDYGNTAWRYSSKCMDMVIGEIGFYPVFVHGILKNIASIKILFEKKLSTFDPIKLFHTACAYGYLEAVETIYPYIKDIVNIETAINYTARSSKAKTMPIFIWLLRVEKVNLKTAFKHACISGNVHIARHILEHYAEDIDINRGFTYACSIRDNYNVAKFLAPYITENADYAYYEAVLNIFEEPYTYHMVKMLRKYNVPCEDKHIISFIDKGQISVAEGYLKLIEYKGITNSAVVSAYSMNHLY